MSEFTLEGSVLEGGAKKIQFRMGTLQEVLEGLPDDTLALGPRHLLENCKLVEILLDEELAHGEDGAAEACRRSARELTPATPGVCA